MHRYAYNPKQEKSAKAYGRGLRVSQRSSNIVCSRISGMNLDRGRKFLMNLLIQKESIGGKHYTNVVKEMLSMLRSAESNAEFKGLEPSRLLIHASAHKGFAFYRPRGWKRRREKVKMTNMQIVLEER
jgi:large subunit ribosomal protein L22